MQQRPWQQQPGRPRQPERDRPAACDDERTHDKPPHEKAGHPCACECHGTMTVHVQLTCDCGRPVRPPRKPPRECCPPPEGEPQRGTVEVPQPPPFRAPGTAEPPWRQGKPQPDSPGEIPWFRGKVGDIRRKGPTFGPRKDEYLPYLLIRAASNDRGARPYAGVFWESPDVFVTPDQAADTAPLRPATQGAVARANVPNTLYAHVWNLGKAPAYRVRVEFYWFDPSLGFSRAAGHLVGAAWVDLADRFTLYPDWVEVDQPYGRWISRGCHAIVRCPETWVPAYVNNGHECLVVRAFDPIMDPVPRDQMSPSLDRHVGQRNIAVVQAASPASIDLALDLGWLDRPADAEVDVALQDPATMEWLQLFTGDRNPGFQPPGEAVTAGFLPPLPASSQPRGVGEVPAECRGALLRPRERFHRGCDPLRIPFHASIGELGQKQAQVLRVRQRVDGDVIGGYSIVLVGRQPGR